MRHFSAAALALGEKVKQTARNHKLDVNTYASAYVASRLVHYMGTAIQTPHMLTGGLTFDQRVRQSADADLVAIRRVSNAEFQRAMILARPWLAAEGIDLKAVSRIPKVIDVGGGKETDRWAITADCGTLRGNTQIDFSHANGPDAFSQGVELIEIPSLVKGGPVMRARVQPRAAAAAEKFLAVIMQPASDYRVKHWADLVQSEIWEGIDCRQVAREIARTCRHRRIPAGVVVELPPALAWKTLQPREQAWDKSAAERTGLSFTSAFIDINGLWSDVYAELKLLPSSDFRRPTPGPTLVDRIIAAPRSAEALSYKPRF